MIDFSQDAVKGTIDAVDLDVEAKQEIASIGEWANRLDEAQQMVAKAEALLLSAEANLKKIAREDFPEALKAAQLREIKLDDGRTVTLNEKIQCGISKENKPAAHAWLRERELGGVIKTEIVISFGQNEDEKVDAVIHALAAFEGSLQALSDLPYSPSLDMEVNEDIHWQTLKSLIVEQRKKGVTFPDSFSVFPFNEVDMKPPKGYTGFTLKRKYEKKK